MELTSAAVVAATDDHTKNGSNLMTAIKRSNSFPVTRDDISRAVDPSLASPISSKKKERPSKRDRRLSESLCRSSRIFQIREENKAESAQKREMDHQRKLNEIMKLSKSYDDLVEVSSGEQQQQQQQQQHQLSLSSTSCSSLSTSSFSSPSVSPVGSSESTSTSSPSAYFPSPKFANRRQIHYTHRPSSHITMTPSILSGIKRKLDIENETIYCKREKLSSSTDSLAPATSSQSNNDSLSHLSSSVFGDPSDLKTSDFVAKRHHDPDQVHL